MMAFSPLLKVAENMMNGLDFMLYSPRGFYQPDFSCSKIKHHSRTITSPSSTSKISYSYLSSNRRSSVMSIPSGKTYESKYSTNCYLISALGTKMRTFFGSSSALKAIAIIRIMGVFPWPVPIVMISLFCV